jgi:glycosyltransferase involved in cell wall biosynthesis
MLEATLRSVIALEIPSGIQVELLVIDNNCADHTQEVVGAAAERALFPVRVVAEGRQGLCHCRNRALEAARFDYVIFLDDDVEVSTVWLHGFTEAVERFGADCVAGPVFPVFEARIPTFVGEAALGSISSPYSRKGDLPFRLRGDQAHELPGCNFGVSRTTARELGGFDPEFGRKGRALLSGEDFEFGTRVAAAGKSVVYHPSCWIRHILTAEKLTKRYLRRRWYGLGATQHVLARKRGAATSIRGTLRALGGLCTLAASAAWLHVVGPESSAFDRELRAIRAIGFLLGPGRGESAG